MTHKFPEARLESLCEEIVDCPHSTPKWTDSGEVVIRNQNIRRGRLDLSTISYTDEENYQKRSKRIELRPNDLIITREAPMGEVCIVPEGLRCCLGQRMVALRTDSKKIIPRYLLFALQGRDVQHQIGFNEGTGSTVSNMRIPVLKGLDIPVPDLPDQKAIAHILGTLDDKIELNQKMNQTLEEIAKAIFKSWFVDFDPVRAKTEGRPTGLSPEISDLFPNELVDSEIGEIPKGWDVKSAESLFDITIGRTPPRKESQWFSELETDVPWVSIRDMGDCGTFISKTSEYLSHDAVSKHRIHKLPAGSVLVSFKLTVGRVAITTKNMTTNEAIAHFPPSDAFPYPNFAYFYLKGFGYESLGSTSSIATAVNSKMIRAIPFIVASSDLTEKFEEAVAPMMDRIRLASEETHVLAELRDTLLPKLISGELRIPDAEKFLEEAGI